MRSTSRGNPSLLPLLALSLFLPAALASQPVLTNPQSQFPCQGYYPDLGTFFFFSKLMTPADWKLPIVLNNWNGDNYSGSIVFNVCTAIEQDSVCALQSDAGSVGYLKVTGSSTGQTVCVGLSSLMKYDSKDYTRWEVEGKPSREKNVDWTVKSKNTNSSVPFDIQFNFKCSNSDTLSDVVVNALPESKLIVISGHGRGGCAVEAGSYISFLTNNKFFSIILIILSVILIFGGMFFIRGIVMVLGFVLGFLLTLTCAIGMKNPYTWGFFSYFFITILALAVGLAFACICFYFTDVSMLAAGGALGYFIGFKLIELINLSFGTSSDLLQIIVLTISILLGCYLGYYLHDHMLIIATSFGGAFLFSLGLGTLLSNYPDLDNIENYSKLDPQVRNDMSRRYMGYFGIFVLLGVIGAFIQYRHRDKILYQAGYTQVPGGPNNPVAQATLASSLMARLFGPRVATNGALGGLEPLAAPAPVASVDPINGAVNTAPASNTGIIPQTTSATSTVAAPQIPFQPTLATSATTIPTVQTLPPGTIPPPPVTAPAPAFPTLGPSTLATARSADPLTGNIYPPVSSQAPLPGTLPPQQQTTTATSFPPQPSGYSLPPTSTHLKID